MKFSRFLESASLDFLNFRVNIKAGGCPHCRCPSAVVGHGYLQAASGGRTRGMRYFCSNRYSNGGCGRTFSVHWDTVIPRCSLQTAQILALVRAVAGGPSTHGAWFISGLSISINSAYRWVAKWLKLTARIRTGLCLIVAPPGKTDSRPDPFTLHHLTAAFPKAVCAIAAFQNVLQTAITG
jgi:hypothetical protein